jgi:hypothetical protein
MTWKGDREELIPGNICREKRRLIPCASTEEAARVKHAPCRQGFSQLRPEKPRTEYAFDYRSRIISLPMAKPTERLPEDGIGGKKY